MTLMQPLIGITTYYVTNRELDGKRVRGTVGQDMLMSNLDYSRSISESGGIPVALPVLVKEVEAAAVIDRLDGLLLAGGEDLSPTLFAQESQPGLGLVVPCRDRYEWALVSAAIAKGVPIFGICRGFQLLNVHFGGSLFQDLGLYFNAAVPHFSANLGREALVHRVDLREGTILRHCYGEDAIWVNSLHHQGIDRLAPDLLPAATSEEGLIEGFEHRSRRNIFGVQWHPEMMTEKYHQHRGLFRHFIELAGNTTPGATRDCR